MDLDPADYEAWTAPVPADADWRNRSWIFPVVLPVVDDRNQPWTCPIPVDDEAARTAPAVEDLRARPVAPGSRPTETPWSEDRDEPEKEEEEKNPLAAVDANRSNDPSVKTAKLTAARLPDAPPEALHRNPSIPELPE